MDSTDVKKLWALLLELYPNQTHARTRERLAAWQLVLEPYTYEQVKQAALEHARKCRFYPSVSELVALIPEDRNAWMDEFIK